MKARILGFLACLLVATNLITGWLLKSSRQDLDEINRTDASMAVGALLDAARALEPVSGSSDAEAQDRVLSAYKTLQIAYQGLYALELRNELPTIGPRWSEVTNVVQGPLAGMIASRNYSELPTVKRRLAGIAKILQTTDREALLKLRETHQRLDEAFQP